MEAGQYEYVASWGFTLVDDRLWLQEWSSNFYPADCMALGPGQYIFIPQGASIEGLSSKGTVRCLLTSCCDAGLIYHTGGDVLVRSAFRFFPGELSTHTFFARFEKDSRCLWA